MRALNTLILFATLLHSATALADPACPPPLENLERIVIDPGHGGENEGAVGIAGIYERFLTMDVAKRLQTRLADCWPELEVVLTRVNDVDLSLSQRLHVANLVDADIFLSIHFNAAANPEANGIEVWYLASEDPVAAVSPPEAALIAPSGVAVASILQDLERTRLHGVSALFATAMLDALIEASGAASREVKQAQFGVLRGALMPALVLELGFLTHRRESRRILDNAYRERLITGIIEGLSCWDRRQSAEEAPTAPER